MEDNAVKPHRLVYDRTDAVIPIGSGIPFDGECRKSGRMQLRWSEVLYTEIVRLYSWRMVLKKQGKRRVGKNCLKQQTQNAMNATLSQNGLGENRFHEVPPFKHN